MFSSRENQGYHDFDVRFHTPESGWVQLICRVLLTHNYKTYIGERSHSSTTDSLLDFCANKTEKHLQTWTSTHLLCLDETSSVAYNSGETQTCNNAYYLFYLSVVIQFIWRIPRRRVPRGGKLWSPETLLYPNTSNYRVFAVLGKSCYSSTYVKLGSEEMRTSWKRSSGTLLGLR